MFFDDLDVRLMLLTAFVFLVLVWILNSILYKPLLSFMSSRDEEIKKDEDKIQQSSMDVSNNETHIAKIYADARAKSQAIRSEHIAISKEKATALINEKRAVLDSDYKVFSAELELKKAAFKEELKGKLNEYGETLQMSISKI